MRLKLYSYLNALERALYFDTDTIIYVQESGQTPAVKCGDKLWDMISQLGPEEYIEQFVSGGPKSYAYTGCPRRNVPDFGRVFLMLKYIDITQNTYVQS
jgi:uncharacterized ParB-like nuclease family protein